MNAWDEGSGVQDNNWYMYLLALCMKYCVLVWAPLHKVLILNVTELEINNGAINVWPDALSESIKNRFINTRVGFFLIACMLYCSEWSFSVLRESLHKL